MTEIECANCPRPVPDKLTLCQTCGDSVVNALLSVPALYVELAVTRAGLGKIVAHANGRSPETPIPVQAVRVCARCADPDDPRGPCGRCRVGVEMAGDRQRQQLENAIGGWARAFAEDMGVSIYIDGPALSDLTTAYRRAILDRDGRPYVLDENRGPGELPAAPVTPHEQAAVWLAQHRHAIRAHLAAQELLVEVLSITKQIRRLVDRPRELQHVGPCPHLGEDGEPCGYALRAERDAQWVQCPVCKQQSDVDGVLRRTLTRHDPTLVTIDEALMLLARVGEAPARGTVDSWVSRGKLEVRAYRRQNGQIGHIQRGRGDQAMYRLGDIRTLRAAGRTARKNGAA